MSENSEKNLSEHLFSEREEGFEHSSFDRELAFCNSICSGNMELVEVFMEPLCSEGCGTLSENPIQNLKYHLVVITALIARYCINGGMTPEEAYSISDFYILKADRCLDEDSLRVLHREMIEDYTGRMRKIRLNGVYSKQVIRVIDYMTAHLHSKVTLDDVAERLGLSPSYLSRLFKSETGMNFSSYLNKLKIQEASSLLMHTHYTDLEIANILGFSSQSYFIKIFRQYMGVTPREYKEKYHILEFTGE